MSALAGIFNIDGAPVDSEALRRMTSVVNHRGPDGIGHWIDGSIGLGHLLMASTPEAVHERQPLRSTSRDLTLVWDGRLDSRRELVDALGLSLALARPATDPDLVLAAYERWGTKAFPRLIGDYAFAIWDGERQELVCGRDPIGVRPFHYFYDGRRFVFGTEIKQVFQDASVPQHLNETMLGLALCSSWGDADTTFYRCIRRLPGGTSVVVSTRGIQMTAFWSPDPNETIDFPNSSDYVERFREILFDATRDRVRSISGVEVMLSGGVDSGSVASIAGRLRGIGIGDANLTALTCAHDGADLDESPFVRLISDRYQIPVTTVSVDDQWAMRRLEDGPAYDEPFNLHFEGIQQAVMQSAGSRGVRVLLTGEGGDETSFYGYMLHTRDWVRGFQWRAIWEDLKNATPAYRRAGVNAIRHALLPDWLQKWHGRDGATIPSWVAPEFVQRSNLKEGLWSIEPRSRRESLYLQFRGRLPLFLGGDIRGSHHGIEMRHPLWDARVVEFLTRIPPKVRFSGGQEKVLLREAVANILPEGVRQRRGHGAFGALVRRGLKREETARIRETLSQSRLASMGVIEPQILLDRFNAYAEGDDTMLPRVMPTLLVEDWLRGLADAGERDTSARPLIEVAG